MAGTTARYHKNYPVSWEQVQRDCRALAWKLLDIRSDWSRLITVARGGLVPAAIIARELNIRLVDTICISSYTIACLHKHLQFSHLRLDYFLYYIY